MTSKYAYSLSLFTMLLACDEPAAGFGSAPGAPSAESSVSPPSGAVLGGAGGATGAAPPASGPTVGQPTHPAAGAAGAAPAAPPASPAPAGAGAAFGASPAAMGGSAPPAAMGGNAPPAAPTGPPGVVVDEATGELVFRTEGVNLEPGAEAYTCYGVTLEEDVVVDGFSKSSQRFVHHAQFMKTLAPEPEGMSTCNEQFKLTWLPIFLAGAGASELRLDEGVGHLITAGTQLVLQMHLFNISDERVTDMVEIRMHRSSSDNPTPVAPWAIGSSQIQLMPRQVGRAENVCTMNGPVELVAVFPHMHTLGRQFRVEVGKSLDVMRPFYTRDPFDFDDQRMEKVKMKLEAGDILRVTCDYMNDTDEVVGFGESSNEEMCFFVGFALGDFPAQADCPNLWDALFAL